MLDTYLLITLLCEMFLYPRTNKDFKKNDKITVPVDYLENVAMLHFVESAVLNDLFDEFLKLF